VFDNERAPCVPCEESGNEKIEKYESLIVADASGLPMNGWHIATYAALLACALGLWIERRVWSLLLLSAIALGYVAGVVRIIGVACTAGFWAMCWFYARASVQSDWRLQRAPFTVAVIIFAVLLGIHALPGFNNTLVLDRVVLSANAEPYTLYLNFDKTLAGIFLLGVCYPSWNGLHGLRATLTAVNLKLLGISIAVLIAASYLLGYLRFEPKWNSIFWLWAIANLFSTCLSEEAFFRGFVQRELQLRLARMGYGSWWAVAPSAMLFGLAHFAGGWRYVLLASLAGVGYGYLYLRTQRIEWSMAAHFLMNTTHFLLFTYPRLAST
jgi:membrane protease YdiL (CAAX protease family)